MSVCPSHTDVTSLPQRMLWERYYKVYYIMRTLGTSLLTVAVADMVIFIVP